MKNLEQMNNMERAALLYALFPQEIPAFIDFVLGVAEGWQQDEESLRRQWKNGLFSFDFWMAQVGAVADEIEGHKTKKFTKLEFSVRLFEGYKAMFMQHCLTVYITTRQHPNVKFPKAIELLFDTKSIQP